MQIEVTLSNKARFNGFLPPIKVKAEDKEQIAQAAELLNISLSEYVRRATRIALSAGLQELETISRQMKVSESGD